MKYKNNNVALWTYINKCSCIFVILKNENKILNKGIHNHSVNVYATEILKLNTVIMQPVLKMHNGFNFTLKT